MEATPLNRPSIRVAFEGCGHGCLHDIYASVERAAALKGWDGVDLLIIGGDFQAVRNSNDLTCMSVPARFKAIGDFHEYYSGQRTAPYLTIFVGGNHEASNYLFELYYGGWVAPNIYYLGAANVIRCGPLRIAGMSGIWKGYDYRKPHFERLPYNTDDLNSIYHVRELDVRKLLQIRTQVDLGLSHDWPKRVELDGDYETLFRTKKGFAQDSREGKLGSDAAKHVLDRLRPAFWFSAHLHVRFAASILHGQYIPAGHGRAARNGPTPQSAPLQHMNPASHFGLDGAAVTILLGDNDDHQRRYHQPSLAENNTPDQKMPDAEPHTADVPKADPTTIAPGQNTEIASKTGELQAQQNKSGDREPATIPEVETTSKNTINPSASGPASVQDTTAKDDTGSKLSAWNSFHNVASKQEAEENSRFLAEYERNRGSPPPDIQHNLTWRRVGGDDDGAGRTIHSVEKNGDTEFRENKKQKVQHHHDAVKNSDEIELDDSDDDDPPQDNKAPSQGVTTTSADSTVSSASPANNHQKNESGVSEELRSQLPASFARPPPPREPTPVLNDPLPEAISNRTTQFMALDKCLPHNDFLQLVELPTVSDTTGVQTDRPYRLHYDKEWLAITRVFANDLQLGDPSAKPAPDKGDAFYKPYIMEAENWVEENIVKQGKLAIPENFTQTAPVYDPSVSIMTEEGPPEYTNPQTSQFCEMLAIENKFDISEEERQARQAAGPRPAQPRVGGGFKGGRNSRRGGGGFGSGGRGGGRGGRGGGRGRGGHS